MYLKERNIINVKLDVCRNVEHEFYFKKLLSSLQRIKCMKYFKILSVYKIILQTFFFTEKSSKMCLFMANFSKICLLIEIFFNNFSVNVNFFRNLSLFGKFFYFPNIFYNNLIILSFYNFPFYCLILLKEYMSKIQTIVMKYSTKRSFMLVLL